MNPEPDHLAHQAIDLLREACFPYGIVASPEEQENYRRLWSRDAMIAGIAGMLADDPEIIRGLRHSIQTLAEFQHPRGMIPSNVLPDDTDPEISYGSLAGRVDATTWFVVGSCLYLLNHPDEEMIDRLQPNLQQALDILNHWEFNGKGLLYTPLSGNWADEYPVQGHTLYDNVLRLWALQLYDNLYRDGRVRKQHDEVRKKIAINFWPDTNRTDHPAVYHRRRFEEAAEEEVRHFACSLDPTGYDLRFDTAGHGLALILGLASDRQIEQILDFTEEIFNEIGSNLMPAFWPVITPGDPKWTALKENYNYEFKNQPYHYHNGGIWPVWMGWFALGIGKASTSGLAEKMLEAWMKIENREAIDFSEYIASDTLDPGGKKRLCYSASGLLFLIAARKQNSFETLHVNR